jgi:hypothetical protein
MRRGNAERAVRRAYLRFLLWRTLQVTALVVPLIAGLYYAAWRITTDQQDAVKTGPSKVSYGKVLSFTAAGKVPRSRMDIQLEDGRVARKGYRGFIRRGRGSVSLMLRAT